MLRLSCSARVAMAGLALCLLIPILGIATQSAGDLEEFHTRRLSAWPKPGEFREDPAHYFRTAKKWLADRAFPIMQASRLENGFTYFILRSAPGRRITLGKDGHVFINAATDANVNRFFDAGCVQAHRPASTKKLEKSLKRWADVSRRGFSVDVVVIPTAASLYADKLPDSVPAKYRTACAKRTAGNSPLLGLRAPGSVNFVYPLREMLQQRGDEAFFPRANWHPAGLSLRVVRDTYLARLQAVGPSEEQLELGQAPSELLLKYGIQQEEPTYFLDNGHVTAQPSRVAELEQGIADLFAGRLVTHVYANSRPPLLHSVLMLSDSYGDRASEVFAGAFRQLIHVNTNHLRSDRGAQLIERLLQFDQFDRVLLLVQEGNLPRVSSWLKWLRDSSQLPAAPDETAHALDLPAGVSDLVEPL